MKVAVPPSDAELPHFDTLLRSGSFHERLERARQQRERIFAAQATDPAAGAGLVTLHKPWERPRKGETRQHDVAPEDLPPMAEEAAERQDAQSPVATAETEAGRDTAPSPAWAVRAPIARTAIGFVVGLAIGGGVAWNMTQRQPDAAADVARDSSAAAATATGATPLADRNTAGVSGTAGAPAPQEVALLSANYPTTDPPVRSAVPDLFPAVAAPSGQPLPASHPPPPAVGLAAPSDLAAADETGPPAERMASFEAPAPGAPPEPLAGPAVQDQPVRALPPPLAPAVVADTSQVRIHILLPDAADRDAGAEATERLRSAGYQAVETAETGIGIRETNVRYYHEADAAAAAAVAQQLGTTARDFTGFSPRPPEGLIEVWLKSGQAQPQAASPANAKPAKAKPAKAAPKQPKKTPPPAPSQAEELQALRDRVLMQLLLAKEP